MIRFVPRSWITFAFVAAVGVIGTAAQVVGPLVGFQPADPTGSLALAPASLDDPTAGLRASPSLVDDGVPDVLVAPDNGSHLVRLLSGVDGSQLASGYPFGLTYTGGVRIAYGDLTGDGVNDAIAAMGAGGGLVRLYNGADLANVLTGHPFGPAFTGGLYVAAGDVNGDGRADMVVAQGPGGGEVRVYNAADSVLLTSVFPFGAGYAGGVRVAAGDVNGDGRAELMAAQATGGLVSVINVADQTALISGAPYGAGLSGGVFVATGDVNADGHDDLIAAPGSGSGPVIVVDGRTSVVLGSFPVYPPGFAGGVRVAAADLTGDGRADIITAPGGGGLPMLQVFDGATFGLKAQALAYEPSFSGGVFVAAPPSLGRLRFTSAATTTFTIGVAGSFSVTTAGVPAATTVTSTGTLPSGVTFTDNGNGTATLAGSPATGAAGSYSLTFTAANGVGPNATQTFTLEVVDAAPRVTATTPANGATAFPIDASLVVTFSEPVNVTPTAFTLQCPAGTPVAVTVTPAAPATQFTIDPVADLPATTACSLRIAADQVTDADADDPPDTPAADVVVSFTTSACAAITVSPTTLTGGNVSVPYGPVSFTQVGGAAPITWSVTTGTLPPGLTLAASTGVLSGTPTASGAFPFTVTATAVSGCTGSVSLTLNVAAGPNQAPSFTVGPNQAVAEDGGPQSVAGWATAIIPGPPDEAGQTVTFHVTGNTSPALFAAPPAVSPTGTLTYTPALNANGTATITLVLQDNGGTALGGVDTSAPQSFTVAVNAVNDAPSFTAGGNQTVLENAAAQTVPGWATTLSPGPADEAAQTLTFAVTNNTSPALFSVAPAVSPAGALTYTPAPNASGTATITLTLQDSGGTALGGVDTSAPQTFTITLTAVNTEPSFTVGPDQTVAEDSGAQNVPVWATAISPGPPDEAGQTVTFTITGNTNPGLFLVAPVISPTGVLTYTPSANSSGTATITLTLSDDGGTAGGGSDTSPPQNFTISVTDVNDAPSFVAIAGPTSSAEDAGPQSISNWATGISAGPGEGSQTLTFIVTGNTNPALFSAGPAVSSTGTLTYTSAPNAFGSADIEVVLQDNGGTAGGGVDTSPPQGYNITVAPVNDAPSLTASTIGYSTVGNTQLHVAGKTLPGLASTTDASGVLAKSGPSDIDGPVAPAAVPLSGVATPNGTITLDADGSFSYVPNANFVGVDSFTVQVTDSVTPANVTVNVTVSERVWYVNNLTGANNPAGGDGRSTDAFETLAAAATASSDNDVIFVFEGDTVSTPLSGGIALKNGQKLYGEGVGLTVGSFSLVPAGMRPRVTAAADAVSVLANTANGNRTGVEIRGLNLTSTGGNAVDASSANAANLGVRISENTISGAGLEGIDITQSSTGTATLDLRSNTVTSTGIGIDIVRTAGAAVIAAFSDNVVSGNTTGAGITVTGPVTFDAVPGGTLDPVNGGTTLIGQSGNGVAGAGLLITSMTGALDFVDFDAFADANAALLVTGTGAFTGAAGTRITSTAGASTVVAGAGAAVSLANLTTDLQLAALSSANSGSDGVTLTNVVGTFSAPTGSTITNAAGTDFNVSGGNATVSYGGTITDDVGALVSIASTTGGAKTFTGAITDGDDGDGGGISLSGNGGATITFSGGLTLSTGANAAFAATGGGTVTVTDPAGPAVNTIATTTGTALNVANTTIGAGGLVFQSIAANGATNGIVLNTTGATAGLTVTGTGANDSGGVIQNTTGDAIQLASTRSISLSQMRLFSSGQSHIDATTVNGLTLNSVDTDLSTGAGLLGNGITNLVISGGTFHRGGAAAEPTCNIHGVDITNLLGTSTVTGATFTRSNTIQFHVNNTSTSGSVDTLTVSGTSWNTHTGPCSGDHLSVNADTGGNFKLVTTAVSGENNFQGSGIGVQATAGGSGTMQASITGVQTSGNTAGVAVAATATSNIGFNVFDNNTGNGTGFSGTGSVALILTCTTSGTCQGAFDNNSITHTAGTSTNAMQVVVEGNGAGRVNVSNNTVNGNFQRGLHAQQRAGTGTGSLSLHVIGNTFTGTDGGGLQGVNIETSASGDAGIVNSMCLNLAGNSASMTGGVTAYRLFSRVVDVFQLQNFTGNGSVEADIQTWVTTTKSNLGTPVGATIGAPFTTIASCATPTLPTP